jgi:hypothetical protein
LLLPRQILPRKNLSNNWNSGITRGKWRSNHMLENEDLSQIEKQEHQSS